MVLGEDLAAAVRRWDRGGIGPVLEDLVLAEDVFVERAMFGLVALAQFVWSEAARRLIQFALVRLFERLTFLRVRRFQFAASGFFAADFFQGHIATR